MATKPKASAAVTKLQTEVKALQALTANLERRMRLDSGLPPAEGGEDIGVPDPDPDPDGEAEAEGEAATAYEGKPTGRRMKW